MFLLELRFFAWVVIPLCDDLATISGIRRRKNMKSFAILK
jgi:hypothetical protein